MSELILAVGDDNVRFQNLMDSTHTVDQTKKGTKIAFYTDAMTANDFMDPKNCKVVGLVLWLPRDRVDAAINAAPAAGAERRGEDKHD